jgi:translation initiation factor 1
MALVYSTEIGRIKVEAEKPQTPKGDGVVRIEQQTKGRKGKGVSIITGLALTDVELKILAAELKKSLGCGGAVKGFVIEIQTTEREKIKALLEKKQFRVKLAGG